MAISREALINANDRAVDTVDTREQWGDVTVIRDLDAETRQRYSQMWTDFAASRPTGSPPALFPNYYAIVAAMGMVDGETLQPLFDYRNDADVALLNAKGAAVQEVAARVLSLAGLDHKSLEVAEGKSDATPSD